MTESTLTVYGAMEQFSDYTNLITTLDDASKDDIITVKINSCGGKCDVAEMIIQAIKYSRAIVICNVVHPSYSMASLIALAGDNLILQKNTFLMFHVHSTTYSGKAGDIEKDMYYTKRSLNGFFTDISYPFLTKEELKKIFNGDDLYITEDDKSLPARIKRHFRRE